MDKRTMLAIVVCILVMFGIEALITKIYPPVPVKHRPVAAAPAAPAAAGTNETIAASTSNAVTNAVEAVVPPAPVRPPEQIVAISNDSIRVEFTSWGGGVKSVELIKHRGRGETNTVLNGPDVAPALMVVGVPGAANDGVYTIESKDATTVVLRNDGVTKTLTLGKGYLLDGRIELSGPAAAGRSTLEVTVGTATPTTPRESPSYLNVDWQGGPKWNNRDVSRVTKRTKAGEDAALLTPGDIRDLPALIATLKQRSDAVSAYLDTQLSPAMRKTLAAYQGPATDVETWRTNLVQELDDYLIDTNQPLEALWEGQPAVRNQLRWETRQLLRLKPQGKSLIHLKRMLLEDAYPLELARLANDNRESIPNAHWVAVKSQYFALVLSSSTNDESVLYAPVELPHWPEAKDKPAPFGVTAAVELPLTRGTNGQASCQFTYYAGPKDYDQLSALGQNQEEAMDFGSWMDGYTGIFGLVLLWGLNLFYGLIHNYGVAIILVTLTIKILFWPIQAKSIRSMKAMQKFQPQIQKIKEKYKDDAARLNQETMKLYKDNKINPVAGCLPMLVQMPVLFGFYKLLMCDIALRGASFLWIKDLALPDTVAIIGGIAINPLPVVMALSGILQQKLTPTTGDPQQAKMMLFMPLVMMFMFYNLAAGLTLYYTLQQLLSVLQQWLALRHDKPSAVPVPIAGKPK